MYLYFVYFSAVYIESESHLQLSVVLVRVWPTWLVLGAGIDSQSMLAIVVPRLLSKLESKPLSFWPKSVSYGCTFKFSSRAVNPYQE